MTTTTKTNDTTVPVPVPPFPWMKVTTVALVNLMNTASYLMTYPFVPFMILSFWNEEETDNGSSNNSVKESTTRKTMTEDEVGYYSGLLEGSFHFGSIIGAIFWGWYSDKVGRRPALLLGLFGTIVSTIAFGLSKSFAWAIISRIAWGMLNGNVGVAKTVLSEVVPDVHSARAFSFLGLNTGFGRLIGPAIGGILSEPYRKYGIAGPGNIFITYPYLLPCIIAALMTTVTMILSYTTLQETLHLSLAEARNNKYQTNTNITTTKIKVANKGGHYVAVTNNEDNDDQHSHVDTLDDSEDHEQVSLIPSSSSTDHSSSSVTVQTDSIVIPVDASLTSSTTVDKPTLPNGNLSISAPSSNEPVLIQQETTFRAFYRLWKDKAVFSTIMLYSLLGLVGLVSNELYPIYVLNNIEHGGFSLDSSALGIIAFTAGPFLILFQAIGFEKLVKYLGLLEFQRWNLVIFSVMLATTPLQSLALLFSTDIQWVILLIHFNITTVCRVASFISCFIVVANSALPEDRGKVNGLGQAVVSVVRALGPPIWTPIFAWSVSESAMALGWPFNYTFTWYCQAFLALGTLYWTYRLPSWIANKRQPDSLT